MDRDKIQAIIQNLITSLVKGEYKEIIYSDYRKTITIEELQIALKQCGGDLTLPPTEGFNEIDLYEISNREIAFDFDLWVDNKKSDLTLSGRIINENDEYKYSIENIQVL